MLSKAKMGPQKWWQLLAGGHYSAVVVSSGLAVIQDTERGGVGYYNSVKLLLFETLILMLFEVRCHA